MSLIDFIAKENKYPEMPRPALHIGPKKLVESPAPRIETGLYRTQSSALHDLEFTGDLQQWPGFLSAVKTTHKSHTWRNEVIGLRLRTRDPYTYGNVEIGDERGVQGRFHKYFGDVLNSIFRSQSKRIRFADFKCIQSTFTGTPDVMKDNNHLLRAVGELKVPWVGEHSLDDKLDDDDDELRKIHAQPIKYMQDLGCVYGFFSNYTETIFLRQLVDNHGI